jgi:PiT family inorganic phosphate transporter
MLDYYALFALLISLGLAALVAGNNLFSCSGVIVAGGIVKRKTGVVVALIGYLLGLLLQGGMLHIGVYALLPVHDSMILFAGILAAGAVFVVSHLLKAPQSLSLVLASAFVGAGLAAGYAIDMTFLYLMIAAWIMAPVVSLLVVFFIASSQKEKKKDIWRSLKIAKVLLIVTSFLMAYTLGANTLGFLYSSVGYGSVTILLLFMAAIAVGSFAFSGRIIRNVEEEVMPVKYKGALATQLVSTVLVEAATFLGIPLSNTQVFTTSLLGSGLSYKTRIIDPKALKVILLTWILGALACLAMGYVIAYALILA